MAINRGISVAINRSSVSCCALQDLQVSASRQHLGILFRPLKGPEVFEGTQPLAEVLHVRHVTRREPARLCKLGDDLAPC